MYINRESSQEDNTKPNANMPRSQSHKKTLSTIPRESKERVIEIEETPLDSKKYLQKSLQLESMCKTNFNKVANYNLIRNSNLNKLNNDDSLNKRDSVTFRNDNNIIKIEENFTSENESSNNAHVNLKDKDFVYNRGFVKTKHNFSGSFSKVSNERKNVPIAEPVKINNLNYVNKHPHKKKDYDEINNYMKNKVLYQEAANNKRVNFSKNREKENLNNYVKKDNNTILTSLISNSVNTNFNQNDTYNYDKNASAHISFSNNVKTNSDINTVNISKDADRNIGLAKDPVNMIFYFNNYILTNQSKATNDDNSVIIDNKNPNNIYFSEHEDREFKKNQNPNNIISIKNEENILNYPDSKSIKNFNSFRKNNSKNSKHNNNYNYNENEDNNSTLKFKNSNKATTNDLKENRKNIPAYFNTKASKINERKESDNPFTRVKTNTAANESKNLGNTYDDDSFRLNKEGNLKHSQAANNSVLRDLSIRNKHGSVLNSIEDFSSFRVDNRSIMNPQHLENSVMYDLASKYSGISMKKIDYKSLKRQRHIDERKSNFFCLVFL